MLKYNPGDRVGAILSAKDNVVEFLGYGVYEGDFDPDDPNYAPAAAGAVADMARMRYQAFKEGRFLNPRIKLDSGKIVWGCECWWSDEESMKKEIEAYMLTGWEIKKVDIEEERKYFKK